MTYTTFQLITEQKNDISDTSDNKMICGQKIKEVIADGVQEIYEYTEEEKQQIEQGIEQKLKMGKKLSAKEMEYLRRYRPDLYRTVLRVEMRRKCFKTQLKVAKSKEEVHQKAFLAVQGSEKDVDGEYMVAMIQRELKEFMKSAAYARLPQTLEKEQKQKTRRMESQEEEEETLALQYTVFQWTYVQCVQIGELAEKSRV